jgi:copper chaperone CopZ
MRQTVFFTLLALAIATVVTVLYAAPGKTNKQSALTAVTAGVEGFDCPSCVNKLEVYLGKQKGISEAKVTMKPQRVTAKLDEKVISASKFITLINAHAKKTEKNPYTAKFVAYVDAAMCEDQAKMCAPCFTEIPKTLKGIQGVTGVTLDDTGKVATIAFDPKADIATSAIADALKKSKFNFTVSFTEPKAKAAKTAVKAKSGEDCADGSCDMAGGAKADGTCEMADGTCDMADGTCDMAGDEKASHAKAHSEHAGGEKAGGGSCEMGAEGEAGGACPMGQ